MKKYSFGLINLIALALVVIVLSFVPSIILISKNKNYVDEVYSGDNEYVGIIEIWHIDSFEGGTTTKEFFLNYASDEFMSKHKGTYVHISNITISGLIDNLNNGKLPDLFSFGTGVGEYLKDYIEMIDGTREIYKNFAECGKINGITYAIPYLIGGYFLFTTEENLNNAGAAEDVNILVDYNKLGYSYNLGKRNIIVDSISFGTNDYISPLACLNPNEKLSSDVSPYDAYVEFVGFNKSTILLGNHRDLARLVQKQKMGKISGLKTVPITNYTDFVQYIAVAKNEDNLRKSLANEFLSIIISDKVQNYAKEVGMLPIKKLSLYKNDEFYSDFENAICEITISPNAFETMEERNKRKQNY